MDSNKFLDNAGFLIVVNLVTVSRGSSVMTDIIKLQTSRKLHVDEVRV